MELNLCGKVALVTGGSGGLGKAICELLAKEGANVILQYRSKEQEALDFAEYLKKEYKVKALAVKADLSKDKEVEALFNISCEKFGNINILVNNAGVWPKAYVKDMTVEDFDKTLKVNLEAPFILSKMMVNHLIEGKNKGKIINIVSQAAFHGSTTGHAHYAASKGGLVTFTVSLAREVAPHGINVNAVAPGIMKTEMVLNSGVDEEYYINRIPLRRISEPEEVANTVLFLASDKADYITGATIDVTGGMLMR